MILLYGSFAILLFIAISLIAIPFIRNKMTLFSLNFLSLTCFVLLFTVSLYAIFGYQKQLIQWFNQGKNHYQLLTEIDRLGGVDSIINRIEQKLKKDPRDLKGWMILGKLYLSAENYQAAAFAFENALFLKPDDNEILSLYETARSQKDEISRLNLIALAINAKTINNDDLYN